MTQGIMAGLTYQSVRAAAMAIQLAESDPATAMAIQLAESDPATVRGTPIDQLSGRPGEKGYDEFKRIASSWGYD